jgi:hypothetical protein
MKKLPPEVLIYIQTVKNFFNNNKEAKDYFLLDNNEELFFEHLGEISKKNFEKQGEIMLSQTQFELLRKTISAICAIEKNNEKPKLEYDNRVFVSFKDFGSICLN